MSALAARQQGSCAPAAQPMARVLQRKCACGAPSSCGATCRSCGAKQAQTPSTRSGAGRALERTLQADMGRRFGHDFSRVRVHTDSGAAASARALGALAYTAGSDMVFGQGRFAPHTPDGRRLLAHELAHVVQQDGRATRPQAQSALSIPGDASERQADAAADAVMGGRAVPVLDALPAAIARTCGPDALGRPVPECEPSSEGVIGQQFLFDVNCDDLRAVEVTPGVFRSGTAAVAEFVTTIPAGSTINVHGFASGEGAPDYNVDLSCHRANRVASLLRGAGLNMVRTFKHGGISLPPGPAFWRSVIVQVVRPQVQEETEPASRCGPDVTDWLVRQVELARADPLVIAIRAALSRALSLAASRGLSALRISEGAMSTNVLAAEVATGAPDSPAFPRPVAELAASSRGRTELAVGTAGSLMPGEAGAPMREALSLIASASALWAALVGPGCKYDFKTNVLRNPVAPGCPTGCPTSVTMCTEAGPSCYRNDLPGNLFYAHVGHFVGFTELTLQLGSQFAQLITTSRWDPPEDTAMVSAAVRMPHPLDRAGLCAGLRSLSGTIFQYPCGPCPVTGSIGYQ